jgi:hypothetical protein
VETAGDTNTNDDDLGGRITNILAFLLLFFWFLTTPHGSLEFWGGGSMDMDSVQKLSHFSGMEEDFLGDDDNDDDSSGNDGGGDDDDDDTTSLFDSPVVSTTPEPPHQTGASSLVFFFLPSLFYYYY